jgi:CDP-paratose 2-epimerase
MRILLTGACGFVGNVIARELPAHLESVHITGFDNLVRRGSERNRRELAGFGVRVVHGDLRMTSDLDALPPHDWIIDCAANPSVMAGVDGKTSSRQLVEHNLVGTLNLLELCRKWNAGLIILSTSRVYSIPALSGIPIQTVGSRFEPTTDVAAPGWSQAGITETFSTAPPVSLYGASKLASETMSLEYGLTYGLPVFINRCGVLAGAGQFGKIDQGIFSYWIHAYRSGRPLKYIGFDGHGHQVRDCLHPADLVPILVKQMAGGTDSTTPSVFNVAGGIENSMSLAELTAWCADRFGPRQIDRDPARRPFDIPWLVLDSALAAKTWSWSPTRRLDSVLSEIADHAERNPDWLALSEDG